MSIEYKKYVFSDTNKEEKNRRSVREKIAQGKMSLSIPLNEINNTLKAIRSKSWDGRLSYKSLDDMTIADFLNNYSFNDIVRGILVDCTEKFEDLDKYMWLNSNNPYANFGSRYLNCCCRCLSSLFNSVTFVENLISCNLYLEGLINYKIYSWQEQSKYMQKQLTKLKLYILQKYDMMFILESEEDLKPELEELINKLGLKRKGEIGYDEQQALLNELDDIKAIPYIYSCSLDDFITTTKTSWLSSHTFIANDLKERFITLKDANNDSDLWYKIFFDEYRKSLTKDCNISGKYYNDVFSFPNKKMWAIFTKNPMKLFDKQEEKEAIDYINVVRLLSRKKEITDIEFQHIKMQMIEKILANYTMEDLQNFVNSLSIEGRKLDYYERQKLKIEVNDLNFAIALVMSYMMKKSDYEDFIVDFLEDQNREYMEESINECRLREALNMKRKLCNEPELTEEEYQQIVGDVFDEYVANFVDSKRK